MKGLQLVTIATLCALISACGGDYDAVVVKDPSGVSSAVLTGNGYNLTVTGTNGFPAIAGCNGAATVLTLTNNGPNLVTLAGTVSISGLPGWLLATSSIAPCVSGATLAVGQSCSVSIKGGAPSTGTKTSTGYLNITLNDGQTFTQPFTYSAGC